MKQREAFNEREFLDFARSYLSEAFPNPERTGCPPDDALRQLARHPLQSDLSLTDHLTCCSPCFKAYMGYLGELKAEMVLQQRERRIIWVRRSAAVVAIAAVLVIVFYLFFPRRNNEHIIAPRTPAPTTPGNPPQAPVVATYVPVMIDLSNAAPQRGAKPRKSGEPTIIPANSLIDLTVRLPLGSELRRYSVSLNSKQDVLWSESIQAQRQSGDTVLRASVDFRHIPVGVYDLRVASRGKHLSAAVSITASP